MKIKEKLSVSTLEGEKLAEWTARAQGWSFDDYRSEYSFDGMDGFGRAVDRFIPYKDYRPDINGGQAMELLLRFKFIAGFSYEEYDGTPIYFCQFGRFIDDREFSEDLNVAICRAVVSSVFGEEIELPDSNVASERGEYVDDSSTE